MKKPENCELWPFTGEGGDGNYAKLSWDEFPYVGLSKVWLAFLYHKCNYVYAPLKMQGSQSYPDLSGKL